MKKRETLKCNDVADYFLSLINEDDGDTISNMQLQKLVYLAQGFYLALYSEVLFKEAIEAWTYGPVVPDLYHQYKEHKSGSLPKPKYLNFEIYSDKVKALLNEIYNKYGQYSAWKLSQITHEHPTWKNYYKSEDSKIIPQKDLEIFFKTLLD
jgi:uncharacterized phage-associated protein